MDRVLPRQARRRQRAVYKETYSYFFFVDATRRVIWFDAEQLGSNHLYVQVGLVTDLPWRNT
jgi:hypothetical protein